MNAITAKNNIFDYREYNIENNYNLKLENDKEYIYFTLTKFSQILDNIYTNKMDLQTILKKLDLNAFNHSNYELNIFDEIYKMNNISIKMNDSFCYLIFKKDNLNKEKKLEIELSKKIMNDKDKINLLYNDIKLMKKERIEYKDEIEEMKRKINKLKNKFKKKEEDMKYISYQNQIIIKKIEEIFSKYINKKEENNIDEIINKRINQIEKKLINEFNKNLNDIKNNLKNEINKQINELENNNSEFKIIENEKKKEEYKNNLLKKNNITNDNDREIFKKEKNNQENNIKNNINNNDRKTINDNKIKEIEKETNNKNEELKKNINNDEYENKINYKFKKEPQNLKYKLDITNTNAKGGWNDIFEIFISYKDSKEYLISPNNKNFNLDIYRLLDNKIILSPKGHKTHIRTIRYFINKKNYNEYLISADNNKIVIIWDITNNYDIKYEIETKYKNVIYSCLLIFPHNIDDNYIITSTYNKSDDIDKSSTKIYSLNNGKFIKYINNTNNNEIYYLLSWYNKKNNKYYIIQFSYEKIIINNLIEKELYSELTCESEDNHLSGFIYEKENNDYLCSSSSNGLINIWDLYNKKIFKVINTDACELAHIIEWNNKYIIVCDSGNRLFKIIDLEDNKIICDIEAQHKKELICIKKIYHPLYGESLLSAADDNIIKLWTF